LWTEEVSWLAEESDAQWEVPFGRAYIVLMVVGGLGTHFGDVVLMCASIWTNKGLCLLIQ
jgi:hypothetical protein